MAADLDLRLQHILGKGIEGLLLSRHADKELISLADKGAWIDYIHNNDFAHPNEFALSMCIQKMLNGANNMGSTCAPMSAISIFANTSYPSTDLSIVLEDLLTKNNIVVYKNALFHGNTLEAEKGTIDEINRLRSTEGWLSKISPTNKQRITQHMHNAGQSSEQVAAGSLVLNNKISIITGLPGSGKTAFIKSLCLGLLSTSTVDASDILIMAPTNKAAARASFQNGASKTVKAKTIHRALGFNPYTDSYVFDGTKKLPFKIVVIDEGSMISSLRIYHILRACGTTAHVVIIGDNNQLESIEPGDVLGDFIKFGICHISFIELHRSSRDQINLAARTLLKTNILETGEGIHLIRAAEGSNDKRILQVLDRIAKSTNCHPTEEVQFVSNGYMGALGVNRINDVLHSVLTDGAISLAVGDKVMSLENTGKLCNGDIGFITKVSPSGNQIWATFDKEQYKFEGKKRNQLSLSYAITNYKAQGCEFSHVIICLDKEHLHMITKRSIFTAITRAKLSVIIIGSKELLTQALNHSEPERLTLFKLIQ
jgi:exodeoxyribonuclease V alpha subunit